jgi:predicted DCC family thiol-disulfide oxidoreductase YuxK
VNTEITDAKGESPTNWVFYDGDCALCTGSVRRFAPFLKSYRFSFLPLQTAWVRDRLGLPADAPLKEMALLTDDGRKFGGAEAVVQIARRIWWAWPLFVLAHLPGVAWFLDAAYRFVAKRRNCVNDACRTPGRVRLTDWQILIALPAAVFIARDAVPPWLFMWLLASALYAGCKWLMWRRAVRSCGNVSGLASAAYLFAWVGMDAKAFLGKRIHSLPGVREGLIAVTRMLLGATAVLFAARLASGAHPLMVGWLGMLGIVLCLHFGMFSLLDFAWQRAGFNAQPLMRAPLFATSLADFWGRRWNTAFHFLAHDLAFRPLLRRWGIGGATMAVFLISGLVHELVISVPARGGYGLPTMYFAIQGIGVLAERRPLAKRFGLGRGVRGWLFTMACTAGPVFWLFHPAFISNVILPMLRAIGAI